MKNYIAKRELFYAVKGTEILNPFCIKISQPYLVDSEYKPCDSNDANCTACDIVIDGLNEDQYKPYGEGQVFGVDSIQALNLATNLEPLLQWICKQFDVYWEAGEPYFGHSKSTGVES